MCFKIVKYTTFTVSIKAWKGNSLTVDGTLQNTWKNLNFLVLDRRKDTKFIPRSKIVNCFNANTENFVNFPDIFCILNEVKRCIFIFCKYLEDVRFLENWNNIFEDSSLKAFLRQSFKVFYFSNLSSNSRYFESVTLKLYLWQSVDELQPQITLVGTAGKTNCFLHRILWYNLQNKFVYCPIFTHVKHELIV